MNSCRRIVLPQSILVTLLLLPAPAEGQTPALQNPVKFHTPEADTILSTLEVFPADNPWNQNVADWPLHLNSANIIASIGPDKPLRYNADMAFILVADNGIEWAVSVAPDPRIGVLHEELRRVKGEAFEVVIPPG